MMRVTGLSVAVVVAFVCLAAGGVAAVRLRAFKVEASSVLSDEALDNSLLNDERAPLDDASLLAAAASAHVDVGDDLSADSSLSDTLNHLLTRSELDETDSVAGEAYGDEPAHVAIENTSTEVAADTDSDRDSASDANAAPAVVTKSAIIPAPAAQPVPVDIMHFKQIIDTDAAAAAAKGPITPLATHNEVVAVPVPAPLPTKVPEAHGVAPATAAAAADSADEEGDSEADEAAAAAAEDKPRFMAERALNQAIASMSRKLTPEQKALISQGAVMNDVGNGDSSNAASSDRVKAAIWVVLAIGGVVAIVEASTYLTDYALKQQHVAIDKILAKTYKALVLLGLVSFLLICFARLNWLGKALGDYSPSLLYDLLIVMFVMGFLYLLVMCGLVGYVLYSVAQYRHIETKYRTEGDRTRLENTLNKERDAYNARSCCTRTFASCFAAYNIRQMEFHYQYLSIKKEFVKQHHRRFFAPLSVAAGAASIPPTPQDAAAANSTQAISYQNFEFHVYLRKAMQQVMEEVAAVHWQVWCVVFAVVLLNALRMLAFKSVDAASFVYVSVIALWLVTLFSIVLVYSMSGATEDLAEHYTMYLPERENANTPIADRESDDPDDELLREAHHIQGGGCCGRGCMCCAGCKSVGCCSAPTKQQELFMCKTPSTVTKGVQAAILLTCLVFPAYIVDMSDFVVTRSSTARYALNIALIVPPLLSIILLIPMVLPRFLLATSVASMSRLSALRTTILKLNSLSYRKANPNTKSQTPKSGGSGGNAGSSGAPLDDGASVMSDDGEYDDDDDSDADNDSKSQRSDVESGYMNRTTVAMSNTVAGK